MTINLLRNPGCEEGAHQASRFWTPNGGPFFGTFDNIWPPIGWAAWWIDQRVNDGSPSDQKTGRPEFHTLTVPPFPDPVRLRSGEKFAKLHTFFRTHYAGWLQQVPVTAGCTYQFSIYAHSWYSDCSTEPHTVPLLDDWRTLASDSHDILQVGIGPGGDEQSPLSSEIVWSDPVEIYGRYAQPLVVEATAPTDVITVWLRSWTNYALQHEDVYWDDAKLVEVDVPPPPPREYERTYVLLPPDVTEAEAFEAFGEHSEGRQTIGFSADDAGIDNPNLTKRAIIAYRPEAWPTDLKKFFDTYYPGIDEYVVRHFGPQPSPLLLWQRDPRWKDAPFGDRACQATIDEQGCFITNLAMAQRFYGIDAGATPVTVDQALGDEGYVGCMANWRGNSKQFEDQLLIKIGEGAQAQAIEHMTRAGCAMAEVVPGAGQHFVLVYAEIRGGAAGYTALDPWTSYEREFDLEEAESWRILTRVAPPTPDMTSRVSLHLQSMVPGVQNFLQTAKPGVIKRVTGLEDCATMKRWAPQTASVYRHYGDQNGYLERGDPLGRITAQSQNAARDWVDQFESSLRNVCSTGLWTQDDPLYVEAWNELGWAAGNLDSIWRAVSIERSFVIRLDELNLPIAPATFCAGVGNIGRPGQEEDDFLMLLNLARETQAQGGCLSLHSYWTPGMLVENWKYLAGRYQWIDEVLVAHGVHVQWMLGECGCAGVQGDPIPKEGGGWRRPDAYNGDWSLYEADILEFDRRLREWNGSHGNRCIGSVLFTTGDMGSWPDFTLKTEQINALAVALS